MANFNLPRDDPSGLATCTGAQGVYSIDTVTDLGNCGKCGNSCATNAGSICVFGTCVPSTSSSPVPTTTPINSLTTSITTPQTTLPTSSQSPSPPFSRSSTASSSSSSNSPTIPPHSKNISSGTAVGIGFGSAIAGALLAGLVIFFLLARRSRRQPIYQQQDSPREIGGYTTQEKPGITTTVTNVDRLLPQPTEDDTLINELSKIRDGIKNHVQNYYHTAPVDPKMVDEARLVELARILAIPTSTVVDLLLNPATRIPSLRLFLAHLILSRCTGQSDVTQSFLPGEVSAFVGSDITAQSSPAQVALLSKWKTISGTLLQQQYSQLPTENDPREASIAKALAASEHILRPFVNPNIDTNVRRRNLEGIMRRAAQYAFRMFCQPCSFVFDYTRTGHPDTLVVFPALLITVSHEGERLSSPRVLSEKEVVTGLGRY